jgi:hypothetical protein
MLYIECLVTESSEGNSFPSFARFKTMLYLLVGHVEEQGLWMYSCTERDIKGSFQDVVFSFSMSRCYEQCVH